MKKILLTFFLSAFTAFGQVDGIRIPNAGEVPTPPKAWAAKDLPTIYFSGSLVAEMNVLLWPDAEDNLKDGPVDNVYFAPTAAQIQDLLTFVKARQEAIPYFPDLWDCDEFALEFHYLARVWAVRYINSHEEGLPLAPPAVGIAYVKLNGPYPMFRGEPYVRAYHAINVILRNDGKWFFIEPQNGKIVPIESSIYEGAIEVVKILI